MLILTALQLRAVEKERDELCTKLQEYEAFVQVGRHLQLSQPFHLRHKLAETLPSLHSRSAPEP